MPRSLDAGSDIAPLDNWRPAPHEPLGAHDVHVWRIRLDDARAGELWSVLSPDERERASRFRFEENRQSYVVAHGMMRRILSRYAGAPADSLVFTTGEFGKPALADAPIEFNLSHSGEFALLAVSRGGPVGIDIERWNADVEHIDLAHHFFSAAERQALEGLSASKDAIVGGFFAAWSRKEAYLKARGDGIAHGLDHFDVTLHPEQTPRLIEDRSDATATERWAMHALAASEGYSAALVVESAVETIVLCDVE